MTNTKFRKRALLSSVAMLLVALVALGSATFAWFNTQNHAAAEQITAKTSKSADITLSEDAGSAYSPWTHDLHFSANSFNNTSGKLATLGNDTALIPVTTKNFSTWNKVNAADSNVGYATAAYETASKETVSEVKTSKLYIKSTKTQTIKITPTVVADNKAANMVRLALVPITSGDSAVTQSFDTKPIIWCNTGLNDRSSSSWNATGQTSTPQPQFTDDGADSTTAATIYTDLTSAHTFGEFNAASADAVIAFDVYVWIEGTDFDCIDSNAGTSVAFSFAVDPVQ